MLYATLCRYILEKLRSTFREQITKQKDSEYSDVGIQMFKLSQRVLLFD